MRKAILILLALVALVISAVALIFLFNPVKNAGLGRFVMAQYGGEPRTENGTLKTAELLRLVKLSGGNTYNLLMRMPDEDLESLEEFLPMAEKDGIDVWVTILPPSELGPNQRSDMEYVDYIGLARKLAALSLKHRNLKAWGIDNVLIDFNFFTPVYLEEITGTAKDVNPGLKFIPVVYYPNVVSPIFDERGRFFDGVQLYYTNFPKGLPDESKVLLPQLETLKAKFQKPVVLGIYASPWSPDYPTSPEYVEQLINLAKQHTDGVMIYTMQTEGEKSGVIKRLFGDAK